MPPRFAHVVFDLDGTLIDSRADLVAAVNTVLASLGLPALPSEVLVGFIGNGARRLLERVLAEVGDHRVDEAMERFLVEYGTRLLDQTRPYPGIVEMLGALERAGVGASVLTNKPEGMSRTILDGLGWAGRFAAVVGGDSLPTRKPDPAGVARLEQLLGMPRQALLLVGDSGVDVATARAAGIACCGVSWGFAPHELRAQPPEWVIERPDELPPLVLGSSAQR